jgi:hypothetical protein
MTNKSSSFDATILARIENSKNSARMKDWVLLLNTLHLVLLSRTDELNASSQLMKISSGLPADLSDGFWAEAANTATVLDNILLTNNRDSSPFQQFFGKRIKSIVSISTRKFGEMVVVYQNNKMAAKIKDRGTTCIWLGYAADHAAGTYRVYNPQTKQVIFTRDVQLLNQTYGEYHKAKAIKDAEREQSNTPMTIVHDDDSENDDDIPELNQNIVSDDESSDEEDDRKDSEGETDGPEEREDFEGKWMDTKKGKVKSKLQVPIQNYEKSSRI